MLSIELPEKICGKDIEERLIQIGSKLPDYKVILRRDNDYKHKIIFKRRNWFNTLSGIILFPLFVGQNILDGERIEILLQPTKHYNSIRSEVRVPLLDFSYMSREITYSEPRFASYLPTLEILASELRGKLIVEDC